jgi:hypothetical protein
MLCCCIGIEAMTDEGALLVKHFQVLKAMGSVPLSKKVKLEFLTPIFLV